LAALSQFSERLNWKIMENEIGCGGLQRSELLIQLFRFELIQLA